MNLNKRAYGILESLKVDPSLMLELDFGSVSVLDVGLNSVPDLDTALWVAEASLAGLGQVMIDDVVQVRIDEAPAVATLGSQMAGWRVKSGDFSAMGSGPARILADKPPGLLPRINYFESSDVAALLLETSSFPPRPLLESILRDTGASDLLIGVFRPNSLTGLVNVLSRVVEVAVFRLLNLGFDVNNIVSAQGSVPMVELSEDCMFEANDAIIYKGNVFLQVSDWVPSLTERSVSKNSSAFGRSFCDIFQQADRDFYNIPADIFAPAELTVKDKNGVMYSSK
ncbi:MAG: hypothetical protein JW778_02165 [Candidatus Altiarchaeota archaeon]|nr:hypothetical protein [Candidatus Altiarchaeota archaeon]